ncbi:MAG: hypothetical protein IPN18_11845 [Ignavibacteriales bacterium]|nr:hypothetical protein [Ignavibacteriales bacterium]
MDEFNFNGAAFKEDVKKLNRWESGLMGSKMGCFCIFLENMLTLYPGKSLFIILGQMVVEQTLKNKNMMLF